MSDLRERLLGQSFAPDDDALLVHVDTAVAVVAEWLRAEAGQLRREAGKPGGTPRELLTIAYALESRADALTQKEPR